MIHPLDAGDGWDARAPAAARFGNGRRRWHNAALIRMLMSGDGGSRSS